MSIREMVARRSNPKVVGDDIPTPPYATRAFYTYIIPDMVEQAKRYSVWDPAAGQGHMLRVFREIGHSAVIGTDVVPSPKSDIQEHNFLEASANYRADLIITNPPYKHLNDFIQLALQRAEVGVAMLVRVQALEGQRRYNEIYAHNPPTTIALFSDRIPFKTGIVVRKAPKMFTHVWLWWDLTHQSNGTRTIWIPPDAQKKLERDEDYG